MPSYKLTMQRGKPERKNVAIAAGTAEAQTNTLSVNIDSTGLRKVDVLIMLAAVEQQIIASPWPPL